MRSRKSLALIGAIRFYDSIKVAHFSVWCHPRVHEIRSIPGIFDLEVEAPQGQHLWFLKLKMACKSLIANSVQDETAEVGLEVSTGQYQEPQLRSPMAQSNEGSRMPVTIQPLLAGLQVVRKV